ncbi:RHS repeat-associated core domain-containing protein [Winogradskyella sp.]|uniref:RHS repeat domain-containing protein n=1 Tax=Winogradskyella sp. TaxID=1883156 RepID=UPI00262289CC|nr:RHS repeat-associated core domain-containing protein [Winogradskyella sp.]
MERNGPGSYNYAYQYKDHLGNIRLTYMDNNGSLDIIEEHNYYPFGLKYKGYNDVVSANVNSVASKFKYNGKEFNDELGLDWYDFHARNYDASLGRWMNIEPLAEDYYEWSPYNYIYNSPLKFIDPTGMGPTDIIVENNRGEELGRIVLPGEDVVITLDTDTSVPEPIVVDPGIESDGESEGPGAVGLSFEYSVTLGGGFTAGTDIVYFLSGEDKGNAYVFGKLGATIGLDAEIGAAGTVSYFNEDANTDLKNAKGMEGNSAGYAAGFVVSGEYEWSNEDNAKGERYPGHKSTTTWETYSVGGGLGLEAGAKMFWNSSKILFGGPIFSTNEN